MRWVLLGAVLGAAVGQMLIGWGLLQQPAIAPGMNRDFALYVFINTAGWAVIGAVPGFLLGALFRAIIGRRILSQNDDSCPKTRHKR